MIDFKTKTDLRASTRLACEIARTNPDRLNESIHAGFYTCAPKTIPGKARAFNVDDIVALRLYQRFMDESMSAAAAGKKAAELRAFMQADGKDASRAFVILTPFGGYDYVRAEFDIDEKWIAINSQQSIEVVGCEVFDLDYYRSLVVRQIELADKKRVVGD